ncbi:MAG: KilA-N domain-containing protein, partial [Alphaproteobacteria bacterium]
MIASDSSGSLVPHSYQGAVIQQRLTDGYINATAMCKAAGKEWSNYRQNGSTTDFLAALETSLGIPRNLIVQSIGTGANEHRGTWVHPQVAINLAQWL